MQAIKIRYVFYLNFVWSSRDADNLQSISDQILGNRCPYSRTGAGDDCHSSEPPYHLGLSELHLLVEKHILSCWKIKVSKATAKEGWLSVGWLPHYAGKHVLFEMWHSHLHNLIIVIVFISGCSQETKANQPQIHNQNNKLMRSDLWCKNTLFFLFDNKWTI